MMSKTVPLLLITVHLFCSEKSNSPTKNYTSKNTTNVKETTYEQGAPLSPSQLTVQDTFKCGYFTFQNGIIDYKEINK